MRRSAVCPATCALQRSWDSADNRAAVHPRIGPKVDRATVFEECASFGDPAGGNSALEASGQ
jgi:hypothetical protein